MRGEYGQIARRGERRGAAQGHRRPEVITCRPRTTSPELDKYRKEVAPYYEQEEDVLTYALFPQVAAKFFSTEGQSHPLTAPSPC